MILAILTLLAAQLAPSDTSAAAPAAAPADRWQDECSALAGRRGEVEVSSATPVVPDPFFVANPEAGIRAVPVRDAFCRVTWRIEGNIGFELWLPRSWNGRLLGAGVGGPAGVYNYTDMAARLSQGFATVTTDGGHKAADARWMADAKARVDYEHRAVHLATVAAKALANRYYGQSVLHAYFTGCSGGGRQALKEMENYPDDYDGVLAGAPGPYMPLQSVRMLWFALEQQRNPQGALREKDWALYEASVTRTCDANDEVRDGIVENPAACQFDTAKLLCKPGEIGGCLTAPRLAMLDAIIAPMPDEQGAQMDGGLFPGVRTRPGPPSPLLRAMWADGVYDDPDWDAMRFSRSGDLAKANAAMPELRADRTAIGPFIARGSKAIIYQGWQDPSTNAGPTIDFYRALARDNGGIGPLSDTVRLFMVPGMYHCRGGSGADIFGGSGQLPIAAGADPTRDMLWALIRWVEEGRKPESIVAARDPDGAPGLTRRLCPFPQSARHRSGASTDDAESFACAEDPVLRAMLDNS